MSDQSTKVVPINPRGSRPRKSYAFPKDIETVLTDLHWRVREAWGVAQGLARHLSEPPGMDNDEDVAMLMADALARLLKPIASLYDPLELIHFGKETGLIPKEKGNG